MAEINSILYVCKDLVCLQFTYNKRQNIRTDPAKFFFVYQMTPGKVSEFWPVEIEVFCLEKGRLHFFFNKATKLFKSSKFFLTTRANKMAA